MVKRKFKDIKKEDGKKESSLPRRSKRQKKEEHEDSGRTVILTNKKEWPLAIIKQVLVRLYPLKMLVKRKKRKRRGCYNVIWFWRIRSNVYRAKDLKWG